jgi:hypothetical protein
VNLRVQQPGQALEAAKLDRIQYVTHSWNLLRHVTQSDDSPLETPNELKETDAPYGAKKKGTALRAEPVTASMQFPPQKRRLNAPKGAESLTFLL